MGNYMKNPMQVLRIDGKDVFLEVMMQSLNIDKIMVNTAHYNMKEEKGSRINEHIQFYLDVLEASVLANDILSGRLDHMARLEREQMKKEGRQYAWPVYEKVGGTLGVKNQGVTIARKFQILPGNTKPWLFVGMSGKGHETDKGLIVMDGKPDVIIRVPCDDLRIRVFASALNVAVMAWTQARYVPIIAQSMMESNNSRQQYINNVRVNSPKAGSGTPYGQGVPPQYPQGQWMPYVPIPQFPLMSQFPQYPQNITIPYGQMPMYQTFPQNNTGLPYNQGSQEQNPPKTGTAREQNSPGTQNLSKIN